MTNVMTLNYDIIDTCLIYEQMCKSTSFVKHLRHRYPKYLRKYPLECIKWLNIETWPSGNSCSMETSIVKHVSLVM